MAFLPGNTILCISKMDDAVDLKIDGDDSFSFGMDSYTMPSKLLPGQYAYSMNTICRGGMVQTRPGSKTMPIHIPRGNLQGMT